MFSIFNRIEGVSEGDALPKHGGESVKEKELSKPREAMSTEKQQ